MGNTAETINKAKQTADTDAAIPKAVSKFKA
jgi:conjugal transfer mating pair stabilization protein TraG